MLTQVTQKEKLKTGSWIEFRATLTFRVVLSNMVPKYGYLALEICSSKLMLPENVKWS
jgi:hypothetical protein